MVVFVVSRPELALNADVRDELLGYAADVRLSAVSCLQTHLEIDFLSFIVPSPSAEKKFKKMDTPTDLTGPNDSFTP